MKHTKKQESITHTWETKQSIETISEEVQLLDLADKNFTAAIKELKETTLKEFKESMMIMTQ